jgi:phospholipase/carboxylesterase
MPEFVYRFEAGAEQGAPCLLLLHRTGGDENDLVPLGRMLAPQAALLSPRGKVRENGMPRFFRRLAEGVFDEADLRSRTHELADWIASMRERHALPQPWAVGFSNGANIAAALLLLRPESLQGAVLFRAMVPLETDLPELNGRPAWLGAGRHDPIVPAENTQRLAEMLRRAGAHVTLEWQEGGHALSAADVEEARAWLAARL